MNRKSVLAVFCTLFLCLSLMGNTMAAELSERTCSITVSPYALDAGKPLCGGSFTLYQVAKMEADGALTALTVFSGYDLTGTHSAELAAELAEAAQRGGAEGVTEAVSKAGSAVFTGLDEGLYLVVQAERASGYREIPPFLISVSADASGGTAVSAYPKAEPEDSTPDEPTPDEPTPDNPAPVTPPYTGDNAAIAFYTVLAVCAASVVVLLAARKTRKYKKDEKS